MRSRDRVNQEQQKQIARKHYAYRQIEKWISWSIKNRGYIKYKEVVEIHDKYNIKCYG